MLQMLPDCLPQAYASQAHVWVHLLARMVLISIGCEGEGQIFSM